MVPNNWQCSVEAPSKLSTKLDRDHQCLFCKRSHTFLACKKFGALTHIKKVKFMAQERRCFKCLAPGHMMQECKMVRGCTAEGCPDPWHHTLLHRYKESTKEGNKEVVCSAMESDQLIVSQRRSYFMTLPVRACCGNREVQTYAMLDTGSQRTFSEVGLAKKLQAVGPWQSLPMCTLSS